MRRWRVLVAVSCAAFAHSPLLGAERDAGFVDDPAVQPKLAPAAPIATFIALMHRRIHRLWGFGVLKKWDQMPASDPLNNDSNLVTTIEIVLNSDGTVDKVTVVRTSGYSPYDAAAIDSARSAGPYPTPPAEIRSTNGKVYIHWRLYRDGRQCTPRYVEYFILKPATPIATPRDGGANSRPDPSTVQGDLRPIPKSDVMPAVAPDAGVVQMVRDSASLPANATLRIASEIRSVVRHHLKTSRVADRSNLPSDLAHLLPEDADEPSFHPPPGGGMFLSPWRLAIRGDHAKLTYLPPGGLTPHTRIWFELSLERERNGNESHWKVSAPGVTFAHAHARKP